MNPLVVDPAGLRAAAPQVEAVAEALAGARSRLLSVLDGEGDSWGADEAGLAFAANYTPAAEGAVTALRALAGLVRGVADGLRDTANLVEGTDLGTAALLGGGR